MTFEEYVATQDQDFFLDYSSAAVGWAAAQKAERERIKRIVQEVGAQVKHNVWTACADEIMERIDDDR